MEEIKHEKCKKCKCWRLPSQFLNAKGRKLKTCDKCRERARASANKNKNKYKCPHGRQCKSRCKECLGRPINRGKCSRCKELYIPNDDEMWNGKPLQTCLKCRHYSDCTHGIRIKSRCRECKRMTKKAYERKKCIHDKRYDNCRICDFPNFLAKKVRNRTWSALKSKKSKASIEYLGCSIDEFKKHIEKQFKDGMTWKNHGKWHIDHITPLKYGNPSIGDVMKRLHYTNTQPLWASENISKGNRFVG